MNVERARILLFSWLMLSSTHRRRFPGLVALLPLVLGLLLFGSGFGEARAQERKTVVVVGGGYGGIETASRLAKDASLRVVLLDKAPNHTEITRLHESATNNTPLQHDLADIARSKGFEFRVAEVTGIDLKAKRVQVRGGAIQYHSVVVAVGGATAWPDVPGLKKHGLGLRTPWEATRIRAKIHEGLAKAGKTQDPKARQALARIVIAGAGPTGVEMAAELAQSIPTLARMHGLPAHEISVHIVQRGPELLSKVGDLKSSDRQLVAKKLRGMGVVVHTGTEVKSLNHDTLVLKAQGQTKNHELKTSTVIWAGGVKASAAAQRWGLPIGKQGRILVEGTMKIKGAEGAYAIGDSAAAFHPKTNALVAMTAQEAKIQAKVASSNISNQIKGKKLKTYRPKAAGTLVALGNKDGVGRVLGFRVRGRFAALMKRGIEMRHRGGLRAFPKFRLGAKARARGKVVKVSAAKARVRVAH